MSDLQITELYKSYIKEVLKRDDIGSGVNTQTYLEILEQNGFITSNVDSVQLSGSSTQSATSEVILGLEDEGNYILNDGTLSGSVLELDVNTDSFYIESLETAQGTTVDAAFGYSDLTGAYALASSYIDPNDPMVLGLLALLKEKGIITEDMTADNRAIAAYNYVINHFDYIADYAGDDWNFCGETIAAQGGDCEDLAILLASLGMAVLIDGGMSYADANARFTAVAGTSSIYGDHVYVEYTDASGNKWVMDPAMARQGEISRLSQLQTAASWNTTFTTYFTFNDNSVDVKAVAGEITDSLPSEDESGQSYIDPGSDAVQSFVDSLIELGLLSKGMTSDQIVVSLYNYITTKFERYASTGSSWNFSDTTLQVLGGSVADLSILFLNTAIAAFQRFDAADASTSFTYSYGELNGEAYAYVRYKDSEGYSRIIDIGGQMNKAANTLGLTENEAPSDVLFSRYEWLQFLDHPYSIEDFSRATALNAAYHEDGVFNIADQTWQKRIIKSFNPKFGLAKYVASKNDGSGTVDERENEDAGDGLLNYDPTKFDVFPTQAELKIDLNSMIKNNDADYNAVVATNIDDTWVGNTLQQSIQEQIQTLYNLGWTSDHTDQTFYDTGEQEDSGVSGGFWAFREDKFEVLRDKLRATLAIYNALIVVGQSGAAARNLIEEEMLAAMDLQGSGYQQMGLKETAQAEMQYVMRGVDALKSLLTKNVSSHNKIWRQSLDKVVTAKRSWMANNPKGLYAAIATFLASMFAGAALFASLTAPMWAAGDALKKTGVFYGLGVASIIGAAAMSLAGSVAICLVSLVASNLVAGAVHPKSWDSSRVSQYKKGMAKVSGEILLQFTGYTTLFMIGGAIGAAIAGTTSFNPLGGYEVSFDAFAKISSLFFTMFGFSQQQLELECLSKEIEYTGYQQQALDKQAQYSAAAVNGSFLGISSIPLSSNLSTNKWENTELEENAVTEVYGTGFEPETDGTVPLYNTMFNCLAQAATLPMEKNRSFFSAGYAYVDETKLAGIRTKLLLMQSVLKLMARLFQERGSERSSIHQEMTGISAAQKSNLGTTLIDMEISKVNDIFNRIVQNRSEYASLHNQRKSSEIEKSKAKVSFALQVTAYLAYQIASGTAATIDNPMKKVVQKALTLIMPGAELIADTINYFKYDFYNPDYLLIDSGELAGSLTEKVTNAKVFTNSSTEATMWSALSACCGSLSLNDHDWRLANTGAIVAARNSIVKIANLAKIKAMLLQSESEGRSLIHQEMTGASSRMFSANEVAGAIDNEMSLALELLSAINSRLNEWAAACNKKKKATIKYRNSVTSNMFRMYNVSPIFSDFILASMNYLPDTEYKLDYSRYWDGSGNYTAPTYTLQNGIITNAGLRSNSMAVRDLFKQSSSKTDLQAALALGDDDATNDTTSLYGSNTTRNLNEDGYGPDNNLEFDSDDDSSDILTPTINLSRVLMRVKDIIKQGTLMGSWATILGAQRGTRGTVHQEMTGIGGRNQSGLAKGILQKDTEMAMKNFQDQIQFANNLLQLMQWKAQATKSVSEGKLMMKLAPLFYLFSWIAPDLGGDFYGLFKAGMDLYNNVKNFQAIGDELADRKKAEEANKNRLKKAREKRAAERAGGPVSTGDASLDAQAAAFENMDHQQEDAMDEMMYSDMGADSGAAIGGAGMLLAKISDINAKRDMLVKIKEKQNQSRAAMKGNLGGVAGSAGFGALQAVAALQGQGADMMASQIMSNLEARAQQLETLQSSKATAGLAILKGAVNTFNALVKVCETIDKLSENLTDEEKEKLQKKLESGDAKSLTEREKKFLMNNGVSQKSIDKMVNDSKSPEAKSIREGILKGITEEKSDMQGKVEGLKTLWNSGVMGMIMGVFAAIDIAFAATNPESFRKKIEFDKKVVNPKLEESIDPDTGMVITEHVEPGNKPRGPGELITSFLLKRPGKGDLIYDAATGKFYHAKADGGRGEVLDEKEEEVLKKEMGAIKKVYMEVGVSNASNVGHLMFLQKGNSDVMANMLLKAGVPENVVHDKDAVGFRINGVVYSKAMLEKIYQKNRIAIEGKDGKGGMMAGIGSWYKKKMREYNSGNTTDIHGNKRYKANQVFNQKKNAKGQDGVDEYMSQDYTKGMMFVISQTLYDSNENNSHFEEELWKKPIKEQIKILEKRHNRALEIAHDAGVEPVVDEEYKKAMAVIKNKQKNGEKVTQDDVKAVWDAKRAAKLRIPGEPGPGGGGGPSVKTEDPGRDLSLWSALTTLAKVLEKVLDIIMKQQQKNQEKKRYEDFSEAAATTLGTKGLAGFKALRVIEKLQEKDNVINSAASKAAVNFTDAWTSAIYGRSALSNKDVFDMAQLTKGIDIGMTAIGSVVGSMVYEAVIELVIENDARKAMNGEINNVADYWKNQINKELPTNVVKSAKTRIDKLTEDYHKQRKQIENDFPVGPERDKRLQALSTKYVAAVRTVVSISENKESDDIKIKVLDRVQIDGFKKRNAVDPEAQKIQQAINELTHYNTATTGIVEDPANVKKEEALVSEMQVTRTGYEAQAQKMDAGLKEIYEIVKMLGKGTLTGARAEALKARTDALIKSGTIKDPEQLKALQKLSADLETKINAAKDQALKAKKKDDTSPVDISNASIKLDDTSVAEVKGVMTQAVDNIKKNNPDDIVALQAAQVYDATNTYLDIKNVKTNMRASLDLTARQDFVSHWDEQGVDARETFIKGMFSRGELKEADIPASYKGNKAQYIKDLASGKIATQESLGKTPDPSIEVPIDQDLAPKVIKNYQNAINATINTMNDSVDNAVANDPRILTAAYVEQDVFDAFPELTSVFVKGSEDRNYRGGKPGGYLARTELEQFQQYYKMRGNAQLKFKDKNTQERYDAVWQNRNKKGGREEYMNYLKGLIKENNFSSDWERQQVNAQYIALQQESAIGERTSLDGNSPLTMVKAANEHGNKVLINAKYLHSLKEPPTFIPADLEVPLCVNTNGDVDYSAAATFFAKIAGSNTVSSADKKMALAMAKMYEELGAIDKKYNEQIKKLEDERANSTTQERKDELDTEIKELKEARSKEMKAVVYQFKKDHYVKGSSQGEKFEGTLWLLIDNDRYNANPVDSVGLGVIAEKMNMTPDELKGICGDKPKIMNAVLDNVPWAQNKAGDIEVYEDEDALVQPGKQDPELLAQAAANKLFPPDIKDGVDQNQVKREAYENMCLSYMAGAPKPLNSQYMLAMYYAADKYPVKINKATGIDENAASRNVFMGMINKAKPPLTEEYVKLAAFAATKKTEKERTSIIELFNKDGENMPYPQGFEDFRNNEFSAGKPDAATKLFFEKYITAFNRFEEANATALDPDHLPLINRNGHQYVMKKDALGNYVLYEKKKLYGYIPAEVAMGKKKFTEQEIKALPQEQQDLFEEVAGKTPKEYSLKSDYADTINNMKKMRVKVPADQKEKVLAVIKTKPVNGVEYTTNIKGLEYDESTGELIITGEYEGGADKELVALGIEYDPAVLQSTREKATAAESLITNNYSVVDEEAPVQGFIDAAGTDSGLSEKDILELRQRSDADLSQESPYLSPGKAYDAYEEAMDLCFAEPDPKVPDGKTVAQRRFEAKDRINKEQRFKNRKEAAEMGENVPMGYNEFKNKATASSVKLPVTEKKTKSSGANRNNKKKNIAANKDTTKDKSVKKS